MSYDCYACGHKSAYPTPISASQRPIVCVSGGFDPMHEGHVNYILEASKMGNVVVILNSDAWLVRKKGFNLLRWDQRATIVGAVKGVIDVVHVDDEDGTVREALRRIKPSYFAKGGDRHIENTPEAELCGHLDIGMLFNIGGGKVCSSSEIIKRAQELKEKPTEIQGGWGK